jgi:hypothetical protein
MNEWIVIGEGNTRNFEAPQRETDLLSPPSSEVKRLLVYIILLAWTESKSRYNIANNVTEYVIPVSVCCSNYSNITIIIIAGTVRSNCRVIGWREYKHISLWPSSAENWLEARASFVSRFEWGRISF